MSDKNDKVTTDERAAIRDEILDEVEGADSNDKSSEKIRRLAREEARPMIKGYIQEYSRWCEYEGPLFITSQKMMTVDRKLDEMRSKMDKGLGIIVFLTIALPVAVGLWNNSQSNDRLKKQIDVAAEVARQLKSIQDASKGPLGMIDLEVYRDENNEGVKTP